MTETRICTPDEYEKAAALFLTGAIRSNPFISEEYWLAEYKKLFCEILPDSVCRLALEDGKPEAAACVRGDELVFLCTGPSCRKKGHASALLDAFRAEHPVLSVSVFEENPETIAFFEKRGFYAADKTESDGHVILLMKSE